MRWPGKAAVEVALITITKQKWKGKFFLNGKETERITPYLDDAETLGNPFPLKSNEGKSFMGSIVLGKGFILTPKEAKALIGRNPKNKDVLFPYLNGDDLNNNPDQSPSRWVINFFDWTEDYCRKNYPDCFEILERLVKPERRREGNKMGRKIWWQYYRRGVDLYKAIAPLERVLVRSLTSKYHFLMFLNTEMVIDQTCIVFAFDDFSGFCFLSSCIHSEWSARASANLGGTGRYNIGLSFDSFPKFRDGVKSVDEFMINVGRSLFESRQLLIDEINFGLTKLYNQFHNKHLTTDNINEIIEIEEDVPALEKNFGKETVNLVKHFKKGLPKISLNEVIEGIAKLRELHVQMDNAVLDAYGWSDVALRHDFYEVDYLPEKDRVRYTIHPEARREVLKRLLELNHKIHEEEVKAGLWEKGKPKKAKKAKADRVAEDEGQYSLM